MLEGRWRVLHRVRQLSLLAGGRGNLSLGILLRVDRHLLLVVAQLLLLLRRQLLLRLLLLLLLGRGDLLGLAGGQLVSSRVIELHALVVVRDGARATICLNVTSHVVFVCAELGCHLILAMMGRFKLRGHCSRIWVRDLLLLILGAAVAPVALLVLLRAGCRVAGRRRWLAAITSRLPVALSVQVAWCLAILVSWAKHASTIGYNLILTEHLLVN